MNTRLQRIEANQTSIAKKVLAAVPICESWPATHILSEMGRSGIRTDLRTVTGCLDSLRDDGLIKETARGFFKRAPQKEAPVVKEQKAKPDLLSRLSNITKLQRNLADELDTLALEIDEALAGSSEELNKLRQLKELLGALR